MNIVLISGSPRKASLSHRIALYLQPYFAKHYPEHNLQMIKASDWDLGLLQHVYTTIDKVPDAFKPMAEIMYAADAFLILTPEYNGTYTPALQNLLDHFPKQMHKAFGIITASEGVFGGMRASQELLLLVPALFGIASPQKLIVPQMTKKFSEAGELLEPSFENSIHNFAREFVWLAEALHAGNKQ